MVAPVNAGRPIVEHQPRQQRGRRHGRVVRAGKLRVAQQRVEETPGEIVSLQLTGFLDCPGQGRDALNLDVTRRVGQHFEDVDRQLEDGHVVDLVADPAPCQEQSRRALTERFTHRRDVGPRGRQAVLEGDSVEEHQATDAQGRRLISLLVGACDQIGDAVSDARVLVELAGRLFQRVSDDARRRRHPIHALQLQRKRAHVIGQLGDGSAANRPLRNDGSTRAVQPPSNVRRVSERSLRVLRPPQAVRVQDTEHTDGFRKRPDPVSKLTLQRTRRIVPLAFGDDRVAAGQLHTKVRDALVAPAAPPAPEPDAR